MYRISAFILAVLLCSQTYAQQARDGSIAYNRGDKAAAVIDLPYPVEVVEQAFRDYFSAKGVKADKSRGFTLFRGASLGDSISGMADLYIKVERKSRQEKNSSLVYLIPGRPGEDISTRSSADREKIEDGKYFLNSLGPYFLQKNTDSEIDSQAKLLQTAEKKLARLIDEHTDLEKRIRALEQKLEENKQDQQKQQETVAREKEVLEALKQKRQSQEQ